MYVPTFQTRNFKNDSVLHMPATSRLAIQTTAEQALQCVHKITRLQRLRSRQGETYQAEDPRVKSFSNSERRKRAQQVFALGFGIDIDLGLGLGLGQLPTYDRPT